MANDIESQNSINSLKASFCRQHFPDLVRFLRNFDISNERGENAGNADNFNMYFLLQAYDHKEKKSKQSEDDHNNEISNLKASCKWVLNNVKEDEVLLAIDEYIAITSKTHGLNKLLSKLFKVNLNANTDCLISNASKTGPALNYSFEDETTKNILEHFSISIKDKRLGKQCENFKKFIGDSTGKTLNNNTKSAEYFERVGTEREELQFVNAFSLLAGLRNWSSHESMGFLNNPDQTKNFYRFIIFTHIGLVYICRRIWKKYADRLICASSDYHKPKDFDDFVLKNEIIKINIVANDRTWTIDNCKYSVDQDIHTIESNKNEVSFEISAKKYQQIVVQFECNGKSYDVPIVFNYYLWNPIVDIVINPPRDICYKFEGIAGGNEEVERKIEELFTKYMNILCNNEATDNQKQKCNEALSKLGEIEPKLQQLRDLIGENNEEAKQIKENIEGIILPKLDKLQEDVKTIIKDIGIIKDGIGTIIENVATTKDNVEIIKEDVGTIIKISEEERRREEEERRREDEERRREEEERRRKEKEERKKKRNIYIIIAIVPVIVACLVLYCSIANDISWNIHWLKYRWPYLIIAVLLTAATVYSVSKIMELTEKINEKEIKGKGILKYGIIGIIALILLGGPFLFSYSSIKSIIDNYDFSLYKSKDNEIVAKLMEDCLDNETINQKGKFDEQLLRIKLYEYYDLIGDNEARLRITQPMKDVEQFQIGSQYAAAALFKAEKYAESLAIIEKFRKKYKGISEHLQCLEGIMKLFGYGCTQDIDAGYDILSELAEAGNPQAQYHLAYVLSHDISKWRDGKDKFQLGSVIHSPYNLFQAIYWYRKAEKTLPMASLGLAKLFSSINMTDSALYYYQRACRGNNNMRLAEAYYRIGMIIEKKQPDDYNEFMEKVIEKKYPPALLYEAQRKNDPKTAIEIYKQMGIYRDYRYIPPIVFEYLALDKDSTIAMQGALQALQESRPEGHFDMNFVRGMYQMLDTSNVKANPNYGMDWMVRSAKQGCKYAKMICLFREMEAKVATSKGFTYSDVQQMQQIAKTIPFANVLLSWLFIRTGAYDMAREFAGKALGKDHHPAGGLMLSSIPPEEQHKTLEKSLADSNNVKRHTLLRYYEMALRVVPEEQKKNCIFMASQLELSNPEGIIDVAWLLFWCDVAVANNMLGVACRYMFNNIEVVADKYPQSAKRFFNVILDKVDEKTTQDVKTVLTYLIALCDSKNSRIVDELKEEYQNNAIVIKLFDTSSLNGIDNIELSSRSLLTMIYYVSNQVLLNEFSQEVNSDDLW